MANSKPLQKGGIVRIKTLFPVALIITLLSGTLLPATVFARLPAAGADAVTPIEPLLVPIVVGEQAMSTYMGKYEVTVAEFQRFVNATGYKVPQQCLVFSAARWPSPDNPGNWNDTDVAQDLFQPVVCVGVKGALAYAAWLSAETGKAYRLPNASEWQYAAAAGRHSHYYFGDDVASNQICKYENTEDEASTIGIKRDHNHSYRHHASCNDGATYHTVVGMYRPNDLGLHDMLGNVREIMQSCAVKAATGDSCLQYDISGGAWHWQALARQTKDVVAADFYGSLEGFRLLLEHEGAVAPSAETLAFQQSLKGAQRNASLQHRLMQATPVAPKQVVIRPLPDNRIELIWQPLTAADISYSVYRQLIDPTSQQGRITELIASGVTANSYTDTLPDATLVGYRVDANSATADSLPGTMVWYGQHKVHRVQERIQAEHYRDAQFAYSNQSGNSMHFSANPYHLYSEQLPFLPAWLSFEFNSVRDECRRLTLRVRGQAGAQFHVWQGNHLVASVTLSGADDFSVLNVDASLIAGETHLEIKAANQKWFELDWFEFS